MEVRRRLKKNKIINDKRDTEIIIKRNQDTIKRIRSSQMGEEYIKKQMIILKKSIQDKTELLDKLNTDFINVDIGLLDSEIDEEYKNTLDKANSVRQTKEKVDIIKKEEKKEKKKISNDYWQGIITASRSHKQIERDVNYSQKHYGKVIDSLPSYIQTNLDDMPNNKGYIWRGVHFYGRLPAQQGPSIMFEKHKGGILVIHEHTEKEYKRYEKQGKNRKELVHKSTRRKIINDNSLMDYLKK
jgi:hypothetical protein